VPTALLYSPSEGRKYYLFVDPHLLASEQATNAATSHNAIEPTRAVSDDRLFDIGDDRWYNIHIRS